MSLHCVQVGMCRGRLCTGMSAAWDVSRCHLRAGALACWSGSGWHRWDKGAHVAMSGAGVARDAPGGLPCRSHVLGQMGLGVRSAVRGSCSRRWLAASPAVPERSGGGGAAKADVLGSGAADSEPEVGAPGCYPVLSSPRVRKCVWKCSSVKGVGLPRRGVNVSARSVPLQHPTQDKNGKFYLLGTGSALSFPSTAAPRALPLERWRARVTLLGAVGRWVGARSCAEHRAGEAHVPGCKHVCERDPGCLNNVKY